MGRCRPRPPDDHRGDPGSRGGRHGIPTRHRQLRQAERAIEHDKVLGRVIVNLVKDDTQLFKHFNDNEQFKRWLGETVFALTYS